MNLWNIKSAFYQFARNLPFLKWILNAERRNLTALVALIPSKPERILDIGSGAGSTLDLLPTASLCVATDASFAMLGRVSSNMRHVIPVCADGLHMPLKNHTCEFVSCIGVSEYIGDTSLLMQEMIRILKPDGYLLITIAQPNVFNLLRLFLGHKLHLIQPKRMEHLLNKQNLYVLEHRTSLMQSQYLCKMR
jgi:SAM-dependent methyltransferase